MLPSYATSDLPFIQQVTAQLRSALRLPSTNPYVARWLFSNPHHPFHPDARILPPDAFKNALSVRMSLSYQDLLSHSNPFAHPFPVYGSPPPAPTVGNTLASDPNTASLNMLLIPAAHVQGLVLGYSMITATKFGAMLNPFEVPLDVKGIVRERFCYDPENRHMVVVLNGVSDSVTGIISIDWLDANRRRRVFFTVPNEEYDFHHLPSRVLAVLSHLEHKVADVPREFAHAEEDERGDRMGEDTVVSGTDWASCGGSRVDDGVTVGGVTDDMLKGLDDLLGLSDEGSQGNALSGVGMSTAVGVARRAVQKGSEQGVVARKRNWGEGGVGPFDMKDMMVALRGLEGDLKGRFFAPKLSRDVLDITSGEIVSRTSGEMRASLESVEDDRSFEVFREVTLQSYYASTLAVSTDRGLMFGTRGEVRRIGGVGDTWEVPGQEGRGGKRQRVLAQEGVDVDDERRRKLEARKQRNRESAARSNRRKKERIEAEERELERLKGRMTTLKEVEERLREENWRLKQEVDEMEQGFVGWLGYD